MLVTCRQRRSAAALSSGGPALSRIVPELANALGADTDGTRPHPGDAHVAVDAIVGYLTRSADAAPTLLVIEDLHWSSDDTRDSCVTCELGRARACLWW